MQTIGTKAFDVQGFIRHLSDNPITEKDLKYKLTRINEITPAKEHNYLSDIKQLYQWLIIFNRHRDYKLFLPTQKLQKDFLCEYLPQFVRYLMYCRQFRLEEALELCQAIMLESINFFINYFQEIERHPAMVAIVRVTLEMERLFFKLNFQDTRFHLIPPLEKEQEEELKQFLGNLSVGQRVDALKSQYASTRKIWSLATIVKIGSQSIVVSYQGDKPQNQKPISKIAYQIFPEGTFTGTNFSWRSSLKVGDEVDYEWQKTFWKKGRVVEVEVVEDEDREYKMITIESENGEQISISPVSPSLQPANTFSRPEAEVDEDYKLKNISEEEPIDDYNDILLERIPYTKAGVLRNDISSRFYLYLLNYFQQIKGFDLILQKVSNPNTHIDIIQQLLQFVFHLSASYHRRFAQSYLPQLCDNIINSILHCPESNIRVFTKDKFNSIMENLYNLSKRYLSIKERQIKLQKIKMPVIKMFMDSEFLDRKLNSISLLTDLIKESKKDNVIVRVDSKELEQWFVDNDIIYKIYHESSHPELISRSSELLKLYLGSNPSVTILEPLLKDLSEPIVKVISENSLALPAEFLAKVAAKLSNDSKLVLNEETISILKRVGGFELWALKRGGEGWVDLVKSKKNKKADLQMLFQQQFDVICRVFIEMIDKDMKLSNTFMNYAHSSQFVPKLVASDIDTCKKLQFLKHFYRQLDEIQDDSQQPFHHLWNLTYKTQNNKSFIETFKNIIQILNAKQRFTFAKNCFTTDKLRDISSMGFIIFKKVIQSINQSDLEFMSQNQSPYGMDKILEIVFENQKLEVTKMALEFIFIMMESMSSLAEITKLKENLLEKCLSKLYATLNYQKYLSILEGILNQSEKAGNGGLQPLARQFPALPIVFTIHNHFNLQNRSRLYLNISSNTTLYELRYIIGKHINAYGHQLKLTCSNGNSQYILQQLLNGLTLQQIGVPKTVLVTKKSKIKRVDLLHQNKLVEEAVLIVTKMFNEYSMDGFMSKDNCRRLIKRLGQDSTFMITHKVDKIFQSYDTDKDDHLKVQDLISYFEHVANIKPSHAWNMLDAIGAREDLKILDSVELTQPDPKTLPRYLLIRNKHFMELLLRLIKEDDKNGQVAWNLLFRLPVYDGESIQRGSMFELRYWLYLQDYFNRNEMSSEIFDSVISADEETLLMGLKIAEKTNLEILPNQLQVLLARAQRYNKEKAINTTNQLILGFSLKLICKALDNPGHAQEFLLNQDLKIEELFMNGLLSKNVTLRRPYLEAINGILEASRDTQTDMFRRLYVMLERGLESELTLLTPEYFELFSRLLILASNKDEFKEKTQEILNKIIQAFQEHESTELNLISPEDHISIGFIKLMNGLLLTSGIHRPGIISFLINQCLFPQENTQGTRKLRSPHSRKLAYDFIATLCRNDNESLSQLFHCNFKAIYQKAANTKDSYWSPKIRSEYGYCGIQNMGCICYMISMIQQFFMVPAFRYLIMAADDGIPADMVKVEQPQPQYYFPVMRSTNKDEKIIDDNVLHQFQSLFANLELSEKQDVDPSDFCLSFKDFEGNPVNVMVQQDAQEFLNMLFDKLENGVKPTPFKNIIQSVYGGKYCNQLVCSSCKKVSERHESFFSLSLEVRGHKTIYQSFAKFIEGEVISEYKCEGCNKKADTTKRCYISQLPNYLIIHLQRICFNYDKFQNEKVNSRLEFPHELDIYPYTLQSHQSQTKPSSTENYQYRLKGIVVHIGSAEYGHYFSFIRGDDGQWLEYNDENVREFDVNEVEEEAFGGGQGWRKDHQNAYLLMYEKVNKSEIKLEFNDEEEKEKIMKVLKAVEVRKMLVEESPKGEKALEIEERRVEEEEREFENKETDNSKQNADEKEKEKEPEKIVTYVEFNSISHFVKPEHKQQINKSNEEFTLDIHLTNSEFLEFIYNISMLDTTVPELKGELLLLCSETYPSSQSIGNGNLLLSQEMPKRFNQLIQNGGWEFYLEKSSKWKNTILLSQSSPRIATKNVMVATISDILKNLTEEKENHLREFLVEFWEISKSEEMEWYVERATQYFEFWSELLQLNPNMMTFFEKNRALTNLLRFIISDKNFPSKISKKRKFFEYNNEQPMLFVLLLLEKGYNINKLEYKGISSYAFLTKLIGQSAEASKTIAKLCTNNPLISQRVCYLLLVSFSRANHSNQIRPLAEIVKQILAIQDESAKFRKQWLFGHPQLSQHIPIDSIGLYGLSGPEQQMRTYYSPLGIYPITQSLYHLREKSDHITLLVINMLLELERDGYINLRQFPSQEPLQRDYTHWFGKFIAGYKPAQGEAYREYQSRGVNLWKNRNAKQSPDFIDEYLVGKIVTEKELRRLEGEDPDTSYRRPECKDRKIQLKETECVVNITKPEYHEDGFLIHGMNLLEKYNTTTSFINEEETLINVQNSKLFLRKLSSEYQKEEIEEIDPIDSPFKGVFENDYVRKIKFCNLSESSRVVTFKLQFLTADPNMSFPESPCRFSLQPEQDIYFVLTKKDPSKEWPEYTLQWDELVEKSRKFHLFSSEEEPPKEIFTAESEEESAEESEEEENDEDEMYPKVGENW